LEFKGKKAEMVDLAGEYKLRSIAVVFLVALFAFSAPVHIAEGRAEGSNDLNAAASSEDQVAQQFEAIRQNPEELRAFFLAMPKGGDIHNHLTGAVYAEDLIDQAAASDLCISLDNYTVSANYCDTNNSVPAELSYTDSKLYGHIVDSWSMRDSELLDEESESQREHFFNTFGNFGGATGNTSALLAYLRSSAYRENVAYLEIMTGAGSAAANLGSTVGWDDNLSVFYGKLVDNGLYSVSQSINDYINDTDNGSLRILENEGDPGTGVPVRFILSGTRTMTKERVFGQLAAAFDAVNKSRLAVGVTLLAAEDNWRSREDYSLQMRMVEFLHGVYPNVSIALHAGELNLGLVKTDDLRFHIKEAVEVAHASRIGHGVDIMWEQDSEKTLNEMAENQVAIEIMPVSNRVILGVTGDEHPFPVYFEHEVPVVLASDDAGVLRTDLSEQFVTIATDYPQIKYQDFKNFVRNSIEYSFIEGRGIWSSKGDYTTLVPECCICNPDSENLDEKCKVFLDNNEKAKLEWTLEEDFEEFEERYSN
jgi:hypothetical protein